MRQVQPTGNFRDKKWELIAKAAHKKISCTRNGYHELQKFEDLHCGRLGSCLRGLGDRGKSAGAGRAVAGGAATAAIVAGGAAAGTEGASAAADFDPGSVEAQSR